MKLAYIYDNGQVIVELKPSVFRELLKSYLKKTKNIEDALDLIENDIKKEVLHT